MYRSDQLHSLLNTLFDDIENEQDKEKIKSLIDQNPLLLQTEFKPAMMRSPLMPLHYAAYCGRLWLVKYLIEVKKMDPDTKTTCMETPLMLALVSARMKTSKYLLSFDEVDILAQNIGNRSPIFYAASGNDREVFKMVYYKAIQEVDVFNLKDMSGRNLLHVIPIPNFGQSQYECQINQARMCRFLLNQGGETMLAGLDKKGNSPLVYACLKWNKPVIQQFLKFGAKEMLTEAQKMHIRRKTGWDADFNLEEIGELIDQYLDVYNTEDD